MSAVAERYGQRPSALLGLPPDDPWLAYCVDEALHVLATGHAVRDAAWDDQHRTSPDGEAGGEFDSYSKHANHPDAGKPPPLAQLAMLPYSEN